MSEAAGIGGPSVSSFLIRARDSVSRALKRAIYGSIVRHEVDGTSLASPPEAGHLPPSQGPELSPNLGNGRGQAAAA